MLASVRKPDKEKMDPVSDNYRNILDVLPIHTRQEQIYDLNVFRFNGFESFILALTECFYLRFLRLDFKVCKYIAFILTYLARNPTSTSP